MHLIEEAFGEGCDLYKDVLKCDSDADNAKLRKAYYRAALTVHPDRNPGQEANKQFQALSLAYQILQDTDLRAEYDETKVIPDDTPDDDKDDVDNGADQWKVYFDRIFGKVTVSDIDAFASKYKCSDEECRDVLKEFKARKGNLVKCIEFVMLSEPRDAQRWVEDYIRPAMDKGEIDTSLKDAMEKSLEKLKKQAAKIDKELEQEEMGDAEDDDTDTEEDVPSPPKKKKSKTKTTPTKAKKTKAKPKRDDMSNLIAQIQSKRQASSGSSVLSSLGARYGVSMDENDPLSDADFEKARARLKK